MDEFPIIAMITTAGAVTWLGHAAKGQPTIKPVVGTFVLGTIVLLVGMADTQVATLFAALVLITAILSNGLQFVTKGLGTIS